MNIGEITNYALDLIKRPYLKNRWLFQIETDIITTRYLISAPSRSRHFTKNTSRFVYLHMDKIALDLKFCSRHFKCLFMKMPEMSLLDTELR